jgi:hypothetical protein
LERRAIRRANTTFNESHEVLLFSNRVIEESRAKPYAWLEKYFEVYRSKRDRAAGDIEIVKP